MNDMETHQVALKKHTETIVKAVVQNGLTRNMIVELAHRNVFRESVCGNLMEAETSETNRARGMILHLQQVNLESFGVFLEVLIQAGLGEMSNLLISQCGQEENGSDVVDNLSRMMPNLDIRAGNDQSASEDDTNRNNNFNEPLVIKVIPSSDIVTKERDNREVYKNSSMPRGLVFLANYKIFRDTEEHPTRNGSEIDVKNLSLLFHEMGYKIPFQLHNLTRMDTHKKLEEFSELPELADVDSCIVVIMSHGHDEKSFYTHDNQVVRNEEVIDYFNNRNCPNLKGKPKIFIFQHCRGKMHDRGVASQVKGVANIRGLPVETDGGNKGLTSNGREPTYTDMFFVYSTLEGYVSYRDPDHGSWLILGICWVFMNYAYKLDLDALMKKVSREVRKNYTDEGRKQICEIVNWGFDRHFFFNPMRYNENLDSMETTAISRSISYNDGTEFSPVLESPVLLRLQNKDRGLSPTRRRSWDALSRNQDSNANRLYPKEYNLSSSRRHRHSSGGSSPSLGRSTEDLHSPSDPCISTRLYSHLNHHNYSLQETNSSPNDNRSGSSSYYSAAERTVFPNIEEHHEVFPSSPGMDYDVVDSVRPKLNDSTTLDDVPGLASTIEEPSIHVTEAHSVEIISEIENTTGIKIAEKSRLKRQLSIPSSRETLNKLNDVKKFFQSQY
ncbi:caspase-2-like isoform X2 [Oratosquilla oratoria]|uniref:caspase-2-like isoform X2 n=1 Tax=Oratosquilla oratoria TaxID=337810 RepID=UPI003F7616FC